MGCSASSPVTNDFSGNAETRVNGLTFYDIHETSVNGYDISFDRYKGKVIYGVNIASACGSTMKGFTLIKNIGYLDGVEILLFPSNQFLGQEPLNNEGIQTFCSRKGPEHAQTFEKADVNGKTQRPVYKFLKDAGRSFHHF